MHKFNLNYQSKTKPLKPYWNFCVGSCHATTALRMDYRQQLEKCQRELGFQYVRFHGLFDDDMSVMKKSHVLGKIEDEFIFSFTNIDSIFDFLLSINMKPFIEIGFMPECLKTKDTTVFHYKGYTSKPYDYQMWNHLIDIFTRHLVDRYGLDEVRRWFFEVWNEPNLGGKDSPDGFWTESMEEYFKLYENTARTLKKVDHGIKVGGPATSNNAWIPEFTGFCQENQVPVDFISTHHYPTDVILGYGVEDSVNFFQHQEGETLEAYEKRQQEWFAHIWEEVDRGVLTEMTKKAVMQANGLPVYYTEWNSLAGLPSDGSFGSSFILKTILDSSDLVEGYSYWTFSDIFEEGGMPNSEFHGGFGLMTMHGIPKASYRAFEILTGLGNEMYEKTYEKDTVDIYALKKTKSNLVQFLAVNHHSLLHEIKEEKISIQIENLPLSECKTEIIRLDESHGNAIEAWRNMGEPDYPDKSQMAILEAASFLKREAVEATTENGALIIKTSIPPQGAVLIQVYL
ncbi:MAG: beta-xylosidase [Mobilitalea sp.]